MNLEWNEELAVGNLLIDAEHRFFLDLIKNVAFSVESEAHSDYIMRLLIELEKYAEFHFFSEENIMISCGFPELDRHMQIHQLLLMTLQREMDGYRAGEKDVTEILDFLVEWFMMHTSREDKKIADHIQTELETGCPDFLVGTTTILK